MCMDQGGKMFWRLEKVGRETSGAAAMHGHSRGKLREKLWERTVWSLCCLIWMHYTPTSCPGIFLNKALRIQFAFQWFSFDRPISRASPAGMSHSSMLPAHLASTFHSALLSFLQILLRFESAQMAALPRNLLLIYQKKFVDSLFILLQHFLWP